MNIFFQTGRTLIRMNEIKLEKMGIANPNHRLVFLIFPFYMLLVFFKDNSFFWGTSLFMGLWYFRRELMQHILRQRLKHEMTDLKNMDQEGTKKNKHIRWTNFYSCIIKFCEVLVIILMLNFSGQKPFLYTFKICHIYSSLWT